MKHKQIGTLVGGGSAAEMIPQLIPYGFESSGFRELYDGRYLGTRELEYRT